MLNTLLCVMRLWLYFLFRFKQKSAEWKAAEVFKCGVCNKVRYQDLVPFKIQMAGTELSGQF